MAGGAIGGAGFGVSFMGIMRSIIPVTPPQQRGELFAAVFVVSYLAFGIPAVIAGIASPHIGLAETTYVYGALVVLLASATALMRKFRSTD